jgi:hypothetical protein
MIRVLYNVITTPEYVKSIQTVGRFVYNSWGYIKPCAKLVARVLIKT